MVEVANGRSLVWGAEAVQALRERLGVGGRTVGALPRGPRQNSRLGLPLLLLPEEARLLAEIGAVTLVSAPRPDPRNHGLVRWEGLGGPVLERRCWKVVNGVRISVFKGPQAVSWGLLLSFLLRPWHRSNASKSRVFRSRALWPLRPERPGVRSC